MDFWNIFLLGIIPVLAVTVIFIGKRKLLWIAPFVSTALDFITYMILLTPTAIVEALNDNEWRPALISAMLLHFGIATVLTIIAYIVAYILKRKNKRIE